MEAAVPESACVYVVLGLETCIARHVHVIILYQIEFVIAFVLALSLLHLCLKILEGQFCWFEALIARNFSPQLIGAVLQRMVSDGLPLAFCGE